jgi:hypothetical protein
VSVDISKIRPGDKVTLVPLEVVSVYSPRDSVCDTVQVEARDSRHPRVFWVQPDQIAAHHPAPREIGVGDRVKWFGGKHYAGTVEHVARLKARVLWDSGADSLVLLRDLTLVEGNQ